MSVEITPANQTGFLRSSIRYGTGLITRPIARFGITRLILLGAGVLLIAAAIDSHLRPFRVDIQEIFTIEGRYQLQGTIKNRSWFSSRIVSRVHFESSPLTPYGRRMGFVHGEDEKREREQRKNPPRISGKLPHHTSRSYATIGPWGKQRFIFSLPVFHRPDPRRLQARMTLLDKVDETPSTIQVAARVSRRATKSIRTVDPNSICQALRVEWSGDVLDVAILEPVSSINFSQSSNDEPRYWRVFAVTPSPPDSDHPVIFSHCTFYAPTSVRLRDPDGHQQELQISFREDAKVEEITLDSSMARLKHLGVSSEDAPMPLIHGMDKLPVLETLVLHGGARHPNTLNLPNSLVGLSLTGMDHGGFYRGEPDRWKMDRSLPNLRFIDTNMGWLPKLTADQPQLKVVHSALAWPNSLNQVQMLGRHLPPDCWVHYYTGSTGYGDRIAYPMRGYERVSLLGESSSTPREWTVDRNEWIRWEAGELIVDTMGTDMALVFQLRAEDPDSTTLALDINGSGIKETVRLPTTTPAEEFSIRLTDSRGASRWMAVSWREGFDAKITIDASLRNLQRLELLGCGTTERKLPNLAPVQDLRHLHARRWSSGSHLDLRLGGSSALETLVLGSESLTQLGVVGTNNIKLLELYAPNLDAANLPVFPVLEVAVLRAIQPHGQKHDQFNRHFPTDCIVVRPP